MKLSRLSYNLPKELVANSPAEPRDSSRLMVVNRETASIHHKHFYDLSDILSDSDVLVFNDTKVFPARLFGKRKTGGKVEVLFLKAIDENVWEILGKNIPKPNEQIIFSNFYAIVLEKTDNTAKVELNIDKTSLGEILYSEGITPIPPYIDSSLDEKTIRSKYQTTYAKKNGSVAAPTAGLHFTEDLLAKLAKKGVNMEYITLHVGLGTFAPIKEDDLEKHKMHSEWFSLSRETAERLNRYKQEGKRVISVGTTTTRVLESCTNNTLLKPQSGETDIFIYPSYKFQFVDGLITNFHLPHSTLLALVSAFVSEPNTGDKFVDLKSSLIGKAYKEAIKKHYRFYSFGDGMLIT